MTGDNTIPTRRPLHKVHINLNMNNTQTTDILGSTAISTSLKCALVCWDCGILIFQDSEYIVGAQLQVAPLA
jgi:hypothetical protein